MSITVKRLTGDQAQTAVPALAAVLIDCVHGGASVSFMAPLADDKAQAFWQRVAECVARGERALLVAEDAEGAFVGTVQLILDLPENQPHRADVAKMLVLQRARRQGVGAALMLAVDSVAKQEGRSVLVLDTVTDSAAARLYARQGWQRVGDVPRYALMPDGTPCGTSFFYKHL